MRIHSLIVPLIITSMGFLSLLGAQGELRPWTKLQPDSNGILAMTSKAGLLSVRVPPGGTEFKGQVASRYGSIISIKVALKGKTSQEKTQELNQVLRHFEGNNISAESYTPGLAGKTDGKVTLKTNYAIPKYSTNYYGKDESHPVAHFLIQGSTQAQSNKNVERYTGIQINISCDGKKISGAPAVASEAKYIQIQISEFEVAFN